MTYIPSYNQLKASYENFKAKPPQDLFERYAQELIHVRNLIASAKLEGLDEDVFEYQKIEKQNVEELHSLGYNVK